MTNYLSSKNFPSESEQTELALASKLATLMQADYHGDFFALLAGYQRILADNKRRIEWLTINDKLKTLFMCGQVMPLDGPMIGIPLCIRDSDFFRKIVQKSGHDRSLLASLEVMATAWNATLADTGLWMGKTFEPVTRDVVSQKCGDNAEVMAAYNKNVTRIGRNFFRAVAKPNAFQSLGLPAITQAWRLQDRPTSPDASEFSCTLLAANLEKEQAIPYSKTGGFFLADLGKSVVPEMLSKPVYALNYRWTQLHPSFPMTCLVDELVQIADGIYLGQLTYATRHFSLGSIALPFTPSSHQIELGEAYLPRGQNYGYQNNGYFLMMSPAYADRVYAESAFPQLRPRAGEIGYHAEGFKKSNNVPNAELQKKFTTLITGASSNADDTDVHELLLAGETVLQMLQRISAKISAQTNPADHLNFFEPLHQLFRSGVAPSVKNGLFQSAAGKGYNVRVEGRLQRDWYGEPEITHGFDYYHGATLNLHGGFNDKFQPDSQSLLSNEEFLSTLLTRQLTANGFALPNILNMIWHNIGKYIFPWAGKSFETISPRKLSMLLDESADLIDRYPARVNELKRYPASMPHYLAVKADAENLRHGRYAAHLTRSWDQGMSDEDKAFWQTEANERWLMGYNLQDKRILSADALMRITDMNYRTPDAALQQASETSGSPFQRQGYAFLGVADQQSILPINAGRQVFQFHYRYPLIGGPAPIGFCLDELVEIANGLFLGQLIYATALHLPFHSSVDPADYDYQLFGYFLLLDDDWERHRQAIGLDTIKH